MAATPGITGKEMADLLAAVGEALAAERGGDRSRRVGAVEEAILARLAGSTRSAGEVLDALEGLFPVHASEAEKECARLREEISARRSREEALEARVRQLEGELRAGGAEEARQILEKLSGKPRPVQDGLDQKRLASMVEVLADVVNRLIGWSNVGLKSWDFQEPSFPPLKEILGGLVDHPPQALAEGLKSALDEARKLTRAHIPAVFNFIPRWCVDSQERFAPEKFEQGVSKAHAWDNYKKFIQSYSFRADLMQGLRTFVDGERQRPSQ